MCTSRCGINSLNLVNAGEWNILSCSLLCECESVCRLSIIITFHDDGPSLLCNMIGESVSDTEFTLARVLRCRQEMRRDVVHHGNRWITYRFHVGQSIQHRNISRIEWSVEA